MGMVVPGVISLVPARPSSTHPAPSATTSPDQPRLLVHFRPDATAAERDRAIASIGGRADRVLEQIEVTRLAIRIPTDPTGDEPGLTALRLARDPAVLWVEPDSTGSVAFTPNDELFLSDPSLAIGQWGLRRAHIDEAWDLVRGSPSIIVAVIDTGIDADHPDLAGVSLPGATFVTAPDPSCVAGSRIDDNGHGTHVAGLIGANGNNGIGIAGIAFGVKILPIKALDCQGSGLLSDVASAVIWATDHGARIINISLGSSSAQSTLHDAIRYAVAHNVFVVAAAGNCGVPSVRCASLDQPQYPGAYPESFAVTATDQNDLRAAFSNVNSYVALAAPGVRIWSTTPTYPTTLSNSNPGTIGYAAFSGTSQAAPFVAGVAALLLSEDRTLTVAQLADRLRAGADDLGVPGPDPSFGAGRVNALRTVSASLAPAYGAVYGIAALPANPSTLTPINTTVTLTNTSNFVWTAGGAAPVHVAFHWSDLARRTILWEGQRSLLPADVPVGSTVLVPATIPTPSTPGAYVLRLDLVREGLSWFSAANVPTADVTVFVGSAYAARYAPTAASRAAFLRGTTRTLEVTVTNLGAVTWPAGGPTPVRLSYHLLLPNGSVSVWDGARASLAADIAPGRSATVSIAVTAPGSGAYLLWLDLVQEGVVWFSSRGVAQGEYAIVVPGRAP